MRINKAKLAKLTTRGAKKPPRMLDRVNLYFLEQFRTSFNVVFVLGKSSNQLHSTP